LKQVKEVSLAIDSAPQLDKFMSRAEQRDYLAKALAVFGISVRDGARVVLSAAFDEKDGQGTTTTTSSSGGVTTETFPVHEVFVSLDFYLRAVVMRDGKAHLVTVAPAHGSQGNGYTEDGELRKLLFGNQTVADMKGLVAALLNDSLEQIASNYAVDGTPWYAGAWTAAQKSAADAEFLRLLSSGEPAETSTDEIATPPQLEVFQPATDDPDEACPEPSQWQALWAEIFKREGWTGADPQSRLVLRHSFYCRHIPVFRFAPGYYRLTDEISLRESNAVFVLNGRVFRKPAMLVFVHHMLTASGENLADTVQSFMPKSVGDFEGDLDMMELLVPEVPPGPVRIAAGTASPDDAPARAAAFRPDAWERKWDVPFYRVNQYTSALARKGRLILKGTVARLSTDGDYPQWLRIHFKEAPNDEVTLCTPSPDIFDDFGEGYRGLIGRTVEAAGDIDGLCTPHGGIRIVESAQVRALSAETAIP